MKKRIFTGDSQLRRLSLAQTHQTASGWLRFLASHHLDFLDERSR